MSTAIESLNRLRALTLNRTAIAVMILATGAGTVYGYYKARKIPFRWKISSSVMVHVGREGGSSRPEIVAAGGSPYMMMVPRSEHLNTEIVLLRSQVLMQRVYDSLREEELADPADPTTEDETAETQQSKGQQDSGWLSTLWSSISDVRKSLNYERDPEMAKFAGFSGQFNFTAVPKSTMIEITCTSPDPEKAKRQLERLLAEYKDFHMMAYSQGESTPFFEQEEKAARERMLTAEQALSRFRIEHGVVDVNSSMAQLIARRNTLTGDIHRIDAQMAATQARLESSALEIERHEPFSPNSRQKMLNPTRDYLERQLIEMDIDITSLQAKYQDDTKWVADAREKRERIREILETLELVRDGNQTISRDPIYTHLQQAQLDAQTALSAHAAEKAVIEQDLKEIVTEIERLENLRIEHDQLVSDLAEMRLDLQQIKKGVRIGKVNRMLDQARITNISVVSPPTIPSAPLTKFGFSPRMFTVFTGAATGLFLAVAFFLLRGAFLEARFLQREAAEKREDEALALEAEAPDDALPEGLSPGAPDKQKGKKA